jgi:hypothetical protein
MLIPLIDEEFSRPYTFEGIFLSTIRGGHGNELGHPDSNSVIHNLDL